MPLYLNSAGLALWRPRSIVQLLRAARAPGARGGPRRPPSTTWGKAMRRETRRHGP